MTLLQNEVGSGETFTRLMFVGFRIDQFATAPFVLTDISPASGGNPRLCESLVSVGIDRGRFETCPYYVYWLESGKGWMSDPR